MTEYTHFCYTPERFPRFRTELAPPLSLDSNWKIGQVRHPPKFRSGRLFVARLDGKVVAFDENTASPLWEFDLARPIDVNTSEAYILVDGNDLLFNQADKLFLVDATTGTLTTNKQARYFDLRAGAFRDRFLVAPYVNPQLGAFCVGYDVERGTVIWERPTEDPPEVVAVTEDAAVFSSGSAEVTCVTRKTGELRWISEVSSIVEEDDSHNLGEHKIVGGTIAFQDLAIVCISPSHIVALDTTTGEPRWRQRLKIDSLKKTTGYPDELFHVLGEKTCCTFGLRDGSLRTCLDTRHGMKQKAMSLLTLPTATEHFLFYSDIYQGLLVALNLRTGILDWSYRCKARIPIYNAPVISDKHLFLVDSEGNFYAFRAS